MTFTGAEAKAAHAFEHLKALDHDIRKFFETHSHPVGGKYKADASQILLYALGVGDIPVLGWGVRVGDCVHNLRSALDHAVWQLALDCLKRQPTDKEARQIQFPIEDDADRFRSAKVRKFLSSTHFGWLDQYQPYHAGDQASHHKLAILRELSNTDKHRVVHATAVVPEELDLEFTDTSGVVSYDELILHFGQPLKDDTPIGEINGVIVDRPDPHMEAHGPITFGVVLDDPARLAIHEKPLIPLLGAVGELADGIVGWISHQALPPNAGA